jgi:hypothetical protein
VIAAGLVCTLLAMFSINRQLSSVAEESKRQQAEEAFKSAMPSKAFCARVRGNNNAGGRHQQHQYQLKQQQQQQHLQC